MKDREAWHGAVYGVAESDMTSVLSVHFLEHTSARILVYVQSLINLPILSLLLPEIKYDFFQAWQGKWIVTTLLN